LLFYWKDDLDMKRHEKQLELVVPRWKLNPKNFTPQYKDQTTKFLELGGKT